MTTANAEVGPRRAAPVSGAGVRWGAPSARLVSPATGYAVFAVGCAVAVYLPIVHSYFHSEDFDVLHTVANRPFFDWVTKPSAGHLLLVRNVIFAAMWGIARGNPAPYFWSILLLHAINTALLFAIILTVTRSARLGFVGATAWAVTPVNEGTLGWYSYAGHTLVATLLLVVVLRIVQHAVRARAVSAREATVWFVLMLIGAQTLGHGVGPALALPVAAVMMLGPARLSRGARIVLIALPVTLLLLYGWMSAGGPNLTSTPADAAIMLVHMLAFAITAVVAGAGYVLTDYPSLGAYVIAATTAIVGLIGFALATPFARRMMLGATLLGMSVYGTVAIGRATVYRKYMPALPVYGASLTRYHYAATAMLALGECVALAQIGTRLRIAAPWSDVLAAAWLGCAGVLYARSDWTIDQFTADRQAAEAAVQGIRTAVERTPLDQPVFLLNQIIPSAGQYPYFAGWADIYAIYFRRPLSRPVHFIDPDALRWHRALLGSGSPLLSALYPLPENSPRRLACPARPPLACSAGE